MKTSDLLLLMCLVLCLNGFGQEVSCRVLKPEIAGKYEGECKKGLAHGQGASIGLDSYSGQFRNGLPEGEGTCRYHTGEVYTGKWHKGKREGAGKLLLKSVAGADSICIGIWEQDQYKGVAQGPSYEIESQSGSVFPRLHELGPGNKIELTIEHPLGNGLIRNVQIIMIGEATPRQSYGTYYYEDVKFPFELIITYTAPNKLKTEMIDSSIRIRFLKPAYWKVVLQN